MANSDEASTNHPPGFSAPPLPSLSLTLSEVANKIQDLRLELADRTLRLNLIQPKYDQTLTEVARAAQENAQLRQELEVQRREHARLQRRFNRLLARFVAEDDSDDDGGPAGQA